MGRVLVVFLNKQTKTPQQQKKVFAKGFDSF